MPLDYDIQMLKAIIQHYTVKNVNPRVEAGRIADKYIRLNSDVEVELIDLLEWALKGLVQASKSG